MTAATLSSAGTSTGIREFRLPDLGEGLTESEIVQWHIAEGDTVELNQIIADVETAKAVVELPSPYAGVVVTLHEAAGTVVDVGATIVSFRVGSESGEVSPPPEEEEPAKREPNLVGYGAAVEKGGRPQRRARHATHAPAPGPASTREAPPATAPEPTPDPAVTGADRPRSTPPVRKLARDLGVTLGAVTGTGPNALITRADVLAVLADSPDGHSPNADRPDADRPDADSPAGAGPVAGDSAPASGPGPSVPPRAGVQRVPIRGMRKHTAAAMVASAFTAPHVTEFLTIDVTPTMELLADLRSSRAFEGTRVTPLTIVAKAVCIAIARNPTLNSSWDEAAQEIVQYSDVNLGIAAATPRGLLVPNIKEAQSRTLVDLARALGALTETARAGRTPPADLAGGTVSITNIGVFGIDAGTPILNPGEAAILAMGAVRSMPWEYQGAVALRSVMTLSLSFDHRLVDGEQGSRFLADVGTILRNPAMVLTMV
ncbi:2-oxo acid dehydrogenase subunit E2 [Arthrobacter agilis]|uniref:dihydrolipoamide acetyltransferase family protein n=1 Tax=Arthrobacter agilis TaxID=37921 RepID=UPI000B35D6AF|nr:dihydrolipoamide acetyltransferase family protein [Arthrobacter agilis]OUM40389.1 branched-chain alpha-keto acid dehydrogenase subunit E2 [Arthrobacter agilis]PPB45004.1 2-oxo acid dehydrogenase subunit E2 [Arthrobacter agilis]TPV27707.1 2-oxo acid dehydrogenase subunit E2 [Arthrobacter agilis]VDR31653.1 Dihydrolipoyllysine-residue acetyltransferase component of pyruvate dehydrogenase complex [Arthrobacter agilis]